MSTELYAPPASTATTLLDLRDNFIQIADATFAFQRELGKRLREIDRKALNAQVLVKRHGTQLAGYGVVAQSFREGAQRMQEAAAEVRGAIQPLMSGFMESLRESQVLEKLAARRVREDRQASAQHGPQRTSHVEQMRRAGMRLRQALGRFDSVVAELEYVVVNGRIEASLKGDAQFALAQVSTDMDRAVILVRDMLHNYVEQIEKALL